MDEQQIKIGFSEGISLPEGQFTPIYYLSRVDEPEFGCEGRPEQGKIFGRAYGYDKNGPHQWEIEETALWRAGLDDNMWVGRLNGSYATLRPFSGRVELLPADRFGAAFGVSES